MGDRLRHLSTVGKLLGLVESVIVEEKLLQTDELVFGVEF